MEWLQQPRKKSSEKTDEVVVKEDIEPQHDDVDRGVRRPDDATHNLSTEQENTRQNLAQRLAVMNQEHQLLLYGGRYDEEQQDDASDLLLTATERLHLALETDGGGVAEENQRLLLLEQGNRLLREAIAAREQLREESNQFMLLREGGPIALAPSDESGVHSPAVRGRTEEEDEFSTSSPRGAATTESVLPRLVPAGASTTVATAGRHETMDIAATAPEGDEVPRPPSTIAVVTGAVEQTRNQARELRLRAEFAPPEDDKEPEDFAAAESAPHTTVVTREMQKQVHEDDPEQKRVIEKPNQKEEEEPPERANNNESSSPSEEAASRSSSKTDAGLSMHQLLLEEEKKQLLAERGSGVEERNGRADDPHEEKQPRGALQKEKKNRMLPPLSPIIGRQEVEEEDAKKSVLDSGLPSLSQASTREENQVQADEEETALLAGEVTSELPSRVMDQHHEQRLHSDGAKLGSSSGFESGSGRSSSNAKESRGQKRHHHETPMEENRRLKQRVRGLEVDLVVLQKALEEEEERAAAAAIRATKVGSSPSPTSSPAHKSSHSGSIVSSPQAGDQLVKNGHRLEEKQEQLISINLDITIKDHSEQQHQIVEELQKRLQVMTQQLGQVSEERDKAVQKYEDMKKKQNTLTVEISRRHTESETLAGAVDLLHGELHDCSVRRTETLRRSEEEYLKNDRLEERLRLLESTNALLRRDAQDRGLLQ